MRAASGIQAVGRANKLCTNLVRIVMSQANFNRRFLRFGLRSIFVGMVAVALIFAYVGNTVRSYYRERQILAQIPSLTVSEPGSG